MSKFEALFSYLSAVDGQILDYLRGSPASVVVQPPHLHDQVWSYIQRPAKRLRPALAMMACGAVGGDPSLAIPAAAGIEMFHTWTLVHDDVIDNDALRRGSPTVHVAAASYGEATFGLSGSEALDYGRNMAILTGDAQSGWATALIAESGLQGGVDPLVVLRLIHHLQSTVVSLLLSGEALDVEYSLGHDQLRTDIDADKIVQMLWLKTGVLCEFAGRAGAMIGKNTSDLHDADVDAIATFAGRCGIAFQLQDDIIGILGDESDTGKPVGSDIREGKLTLIVFEALSKASPAQRASLLSVLGNREASSSEVSEATALMQELGGVARVSALATEYIDGALPLLDRLPASESKALLQSWAEFMIDRRF